MVTIESTPDMAAKIYQMMERNLAVVRRRLGRPLTLADKVLLGHLDDPEHQEMEPGRSYLFLRPDRVVLQDVLGQTAMLQFRQTRRNTVAVPTTIHCDHLIQARVEGERDLRESLAENQEVYDFLKSAAAKYGAGFWGPGAGIIHQVVLENYAFPGELIIGTDSHTPNAGGLGACSVGVGGADAVEVMAGLPWEVLYPRHIAVVLTGKLSGWTAPKDVILYVAGQLTVSGGTNAIVEYIGPGARTISATGKATITNMGAELGATTSMFPYDEKMALYLRATGRGDLVPLAERYKEMLAPDADVEAHPEKYYDVVVELDLSQLEPHVVGPHTPDRARPIGKLAAEVADAANAFPDTIASALIGSCTNSSYEDMSRAADVAEQAKAHGLKAATPLMVTPGSEQVRATIERDGQMQSLRDINGTVLANACGPCIGQWRRAKEATAAANTHRHLVQPQLPGAQRRRADDDELHRQPRDRHRARACRPALVQSAHRHARRRRRQDVQARAAQAAPEVPPRNFDRGAQRVRRAARRRQRHHALREPAQRAAADDGAVAGVGRQGLPRHAGAAEDEGQDDHRPHLAGRRVAALPRPPRQVQRQHVPHRDQRLHRRARQDEERADRRGGETVSKVARDYKARGVKWVVVGDHNYGEGSSREHAALSPRLLGGAAVIARSFARIHESNLKKQGLLALTFSDPADYDKIREDDRISLVGLAEMAPGKPVECRVTHADGTTETLLLKHSYTASQLEWFRKGSALNLFHGK